MPKRGPKTDRGRAAVRLNAVRHAVLSQSPVIPEVETEEDWQAHRARLFQDLEPHGALEAALVERIALTLWQHQRLIRFQRAAVIRGTIFGVESLAIDEAYARHRGGTPPDEQDEDDPEDRARREGRVERRIIECVIPMDHDLNKIMRYEAHLNRQLYQAMHELEALQARLHGGHVPLARLDVHGLPDP